VIGREDIAERSSIELFRYVKGENLEDIWIVVKSNKGRSLDPPTQLRA
jgi:hypothetical protein